MTGQELTIGSFGISIILSILLRMIYNTVDIGNRFKPWIAVLMGMGLGMVALIYTGEIVSAKVIIDYLLRGFMTGATAVGFYEMTQKREVVQ